MKSWHRNDKNENFTAGPQSIFTLDSLIPSLFPFVNSFLFCLPFVTSLPYFPLSIPYFAGFKSISPCSFLLFLPFAPFPPLPLPPPMVYGLVMPSPHFLFSCFSSFVSFFPLPLWFYFLSSLFLLEFFFPFFPPCPCPRFIFICFLIWKLPSSFPLCQSPASCLYCSFFLFLRLPSMRSSMFPQNYANKFDSNNDASNKCKNERIFLNFRDAWQTHGQTNGLTKPLIQYRVVFCN